MSSAMSTDPFAVLGLPPYAGEEEVRARYLQLVKQFPPEREPERFREIRAAFEATKDPQAVARRLIAPPDDQVPLWSEVLEAQKRNPPRLAVPFLLSLGNRAAEDAASAPGSEGAA